MSISPLIKALKKHWQEQGTKPLSQLVRDEVHCKHNVIRSDFVRYDYTKTYFDSVARDYFINYAREHDFQNCLKDMLAGAPVNKTENRAALHARLRRPQDYKAEGAQWQKMQALAEKIRQEGKIKYIVNIGIGGSDLGPRLLCHALKPFQQDKSLRFFFLSNCDRSALDEVLAKIDPTQTMLIVSSKSFTTPETLMNLEHLQAGITTPLAKRVAVTANAAAAQDLGFAEDDIFLISEAVGGRFSLWSAIGLPALIAIGAENFAAFLSGGAQIDDHVQQGNLADNIPFMMAAIGLWHRNICDYPALAVLPYSSRLEYLPLYLQQLEMESNGKSTGLNGRPVEVATCPILFGQVGTNGQHAFHQLLHQGSDITPCDFISFYDLKMGSENMNRALLANALAQAEALAEGAENRENPHRHFAGNRPSCHLHFSTFAPQSLGNLIALYEYKVFYQALFWGINPFDQWGVELGKILARNIIDGIGKDKLSLSSQNFITDINF